MSDMITDAEIQIVNEKLNALHLDDTPASGYWSGCNYYINHGKNEFEPVGTATSMHDCDGCTGNKLEACTDKKTACVWRLEAKT